MLHFEAGSEVAGTVLPVDLPDMLRGAPHQGSREHLCTSSGYPRTLLPLITLTMRQIGAAYLWRVVESPPNPQPCLVLKHPRRRAVHRCPSSHKGCSIQEHAGKTPELTDPRALPAVAT